MIKSGGFKISAREIEEVIAGHPSVREVAVDVAERADRDQNSQSRFRSIRGGTERI